MYGYVFIATNSSTGKKYIGINKAVKFNANYIGETDSMLTDIVTYGKSSFNVAMLMPYEDENSLNKGLDFFIKKYGALTDSSFYNCEKSEKPVKRTRKKKVEDE